MKGYIKKTRRWGIECYTAWIKDQTGLRLADSIHMSEAGARAWVLRTMAQY
jgi:hypothetical protein